MKLLRSLAIVASSFAAAFPTHAQDVTLRAHTLVPAGATGVAKLLNPWCEKLTKESGGRIKCQVYPSMQLGGTPPQLYDQVKDGVVDLVWTLPGYTAGRFPASEVFELPFMTSSAEGSSRALWEYVVANNLAATEYRDVKAIAFHVHDEGYIHTISKQVRTLADFKGLKLRAPTRLTNKMLAAFGATPVGMPVPQVPEALSKGVIDGAVVPWEIVPSVKVHELVKFHTETDPKSRALYTSVFIVAMNKAKYENLPAELKKVVDANSGAATSQWIGKTWDESAAPARKLAEARGNTFYTVPAAELAAWEKASQAVYEDWVREVGAKGLNGAALLKSARDLILKYDPR
jgi:TRAP-type transport system periplasmic protein